MTFSPNTKAIYKFTRPVYKSGDYAEYFGYLAQISKADLAGAHLQLSDVARFHVTVQHFRIAGLVDFMKLPNANGFLTITQKGLDYLAYHTIKNGFAHSFYIPKSKLRKS